jgi:hypothetical protein
VIAALAALSSLCARAAPVYQPPGANLTYGDVTHGQRALSAAGNPAAAAADATRLLETAAGRRGSAVISVVGGLEFGNLDELYERIDAIAQDFRPSPPDDGGSGGEDPGQLPEGGIDLGGIIEICCPDFADVTARVAREVKTRSAVLALLAVDAYAKAFQSVDIPILLDSELAGGTWTLGFNWSGSAKAYGLTDPNIRFNAGDAQADLAAQYDLQPGDPETIFDIVGDVDIAFDPRTGRVRALLDNDSTLITKASKTTEISLGYSRQALASPGGQLFLGAEAKYFGLELSRVGVRFGDITDSEELFEIIQDSSFRSDHGLGLDAGLLWVTDRYQLGASLTNINEPVFEYETLDYTNYANAELVARLSQDRIYRMERQLKLEASFFPLNSRWGINLGLDANPAEDPMGDEFQWLTLSGGLSTRFAWLPDLRFGYRRNLAGSELQYLGFGATVLKWINIDLAVEMDRVTVDGDTLPRGVLLSTGVQFDF